MKSKNASPQLSEELQIRANEIWQTLDETGTSIAEEAIAAEKAALQEEIDRLQAQLQDKQDQMKRLDARREEARKQLEAMLLAGLGDDAILAAMRAQYRVRRSGSHRSSGSQRKSTATVSGDVRQLVLDHLDTDGLTAAEIRKQVGPISPTVSTVLKTLVQEGAIIKEGEGKSARYKLKG